MELFETHGTFSENSRNFAENRWNFIKPMELKTDGTFLRAKKTMELFHRFHRFLMDKKHPAPGTGFHRQNYYERNSHCKNVIVLY